MLSCSEIKVGEFEDKRSEEGFKFILSHFEHQTQIWPRTISTQLTNRAQITVYDERYALAKFKQSNLVDCRINGYPTHTEYHGIMRQTPDFIFIDLDLEISHMEKDVQTFEDAKEILVKKQKQLLLQMTTIMHQKYYNVPYGSNRP